MGHVICSVKTGRNQKLNVFNYFEGKSKVALNEKAVERNNKIILHFATYPRHRRCFLNLSPNY
jgi:hypothetical protein